MASSQRKKTHGAGGLYNVAAIRRDFEKHRDGEIDVTNNLFSVAQLETWLSLDSHAAPVETVASQV